MSRAFVGLGSNLGDPEQHLNAAFRELDDLPHTELRRRSSLYRSRPVGPAGQPDYVNAVVQLRTELKPLELLDHCQAIEFAHGRKREGVRWGPRSLDLDLLLFDELRIESERLTVPHPELTRRNFVLGPLVEIAPDIRIPGAGNARVLLEALGSGGLVRLEGRE